MPVKEKVEHLLGLFFGVLVTGHPTPRLERAEIRLNRQEFRVCKGYP